VSDLYRRIDEKAKLAGTNKLEILLFALGADPQTGQRATYGINVFKVREVMRTPEITRAPEMPHAVMGMVSLRGMLVPVIDLATYIGLQNASAAQIMIVTEYNGHTQGLLVETVDTILRLDWLSMKVPPEMLVSQTGGFVTAVTELADGRLVMMLDVERVLAETACGDEAVLYRDIKPLKAGERTVLFVDDSVVARRQIERTLDALGIRHLSSTNGNQAWRELERIAAHAEANKCRVADLVQAVLTDIEMPEMDGFMLTRRIKSDARFADIQVIMHSSLSGDQNQRLGTSVGVDDYVSKFEPQRLAEVLSRRLAA
jgi:two-component system chemotaxis response regulator CheV